MFFFDCISSRSKYPESLSINANFDASLCAESVEAKSEPGGKSGEKVKSEPKPRGELNVKSEPKVKSEPHVKDSREVKVKPEPGAAPAQTRRRFRGTTENKALLAPPWSLRGASAAASDGQQKSAASTSTSTAGGSCYFVFLRNRDNTFDAYPLHTWFSFTQLLNYRHIHSLCIFSIVLPNELPMNVHVRVPYNLVFKPTSRHLSDEEAEAEFSRRHKARNLFTLMMRYREQEAAGSTEGAGEAAAPAPGTFSRSFPNYCSYTLALSQKCICR